MSFSYDINTSKKDTGSTVSLTLCHMFYYIINLFLSTFLIAHIYSLTTDMYSYAMNVAIFELSAYAVMLVVYYLFSFVVDKTNRVWVYRLGSILLASFVIVTIFYGQDLAKIVVLAGLLKGFSHGTYYASYNVLKQEMVSRNSMDKIVVLLTVISKIVSVVCPIILGTLIEVSAFSTVAIYVFVLSLIMITISFFIKSKKPQDSKFSIREYLKKTKENPEFNKKIKEVYKISIFYGFSSIVAVLLNINIMVQLGSNFSLGLMTSVFSILSIIVLLLTSKFTKRGKRSWIFIISSIIPITSAIIFAILPNVWTLIAYNFCYSVSEVICATIYDSIRNKNLKESGLYSYIAEHQCVVESIFQICRIIAYGLMLLFSYFYSFVLYQIFFVIAVSSYTFIAVMLNKYEKVHDNKQ